MEATNTKFVPDCIKSNFLHSFIIVQVDTENKPGIYTVSGCSISLCSGGGQGAGAWENRGWEGYYGRREKKGREVGEKLKKGSICYLLTAYHPVKNKPSNIFDFHLMFSEAPNKILYARKRKFVLGLKKKTG